MNVSLVTDAEQSSPTVMSGVIPQSDTRFQGMSVFEEIFRREHCIEKPWLFPISLPENSITGDNVTQRYGVWGSEATYRRKRWFKGNLPFQSSLMTVPWRPKAESDFAWYWHSLPIISRYLQLPLWEYKVRKATCLFWQHWKTCRDWPRLLQVVAWKIWMCSAKETGNPASQRNVNGQWTEEHQIRGFMRKHFYRFQQVWFNHRRP